MQDGQPSRTALSTAAARAAHLVVDHEPHILHDTVAAALLGDRAEEMLGYHRAHGDHLVLSGTRALVTARGAYTERLLADRSPDQYVILGAGLDTFAHRHSGVRVFEVDHPATQEWKRALLSRAGIPIPGHLAFVPVDLESGALLDRLTAAGFDPRRSALVGWLGVTMYLTRDAISATLAELGRLSPGSELVMEYALPAELRDATGNEYAAIAAEVVRESNEPYLTFLSPDDVTTLMKRHGLEVLDHVTMHDAVPPSTWTRTDALRPFTWTRLAHATIPRP
ncbi:class I SAM-dependent methyltransferase [Actinomadura miaoliensis]|uniref:S-adenosyl-L-methionine-dependent methyltransferase n=1 Tax=Actinomadura miaoliensis TaxID=430685 RepID=A0ABP7WN89_9ACTN